MKEAFNLTYLGLFPLGKSPSGKGMGIRVEAITKNRQSEGKLREMAERAFGRENALLSSRELSEGFCNVAYELTMASGEAFIMKIAPAKDVALMSCEIEMMRTEVRAMQLARERGILGVPQVIYYDASREICSGEYFIMEKLDGKSYFAAKKELSKEQQAALEFEIGRQLCGLHAITGTKFGHFCEESLQFSLWYDAFYSMISRVMEDGRKIQVSVGVPYGEILKKLEQHKAYFAEVVKPQFIHFDSWDGNIFVKDGEFVALIDWERALWAESLMEDRFRFHGVNEDFLRGCGMTALTAAQQIRSYWYDVYLYVIMMLEGTFRHYETDDQYRWVNGLFLQVWDRLAGI